MEIRRAIKSDIPDIEHLLYQVHGVHAEIRPDLFKKGQKKYTTADLEQLITDDERPIYVYSDGAVLGYAFCIYQHQGNHSLQTIKTMYIDDICVDEKERGKGIASSLFEYVKEVAKAEGCYNITLNVWEGNDPARKLYEKCGMVPLKTTMELKI